MFDMMLLWSAGPVTIGYSFKEVTENSVYTARRVSTAMIFVRCRDEASHHPSESVSPEDWFTPSKIRC